MSKYLDPKNDLVFKRIFGEHPHLLKSFLNAILPLPEDGLIETLEYLPTEQVPIIPILKRSIVDVKCRDKKGRIFIVEMQMEWTDSFTQRLLFNTASAYVKQLSTGENYELLHPVYGLALINEIFEKNTMDWYHHYGLVKIGNGAGKTIEGLCLVFVELPKFPVKTTDAKQLKILWLRFLKEISSLTQTIPNELLAVPEIKEAVALTESAAYTDAELETYAKYWDAISTEKTLVSGKFAEGIEEGKKYLIKQMIQHGCSLRDIASMTGLSEQDIESIIEK